MAWYKKQEKQNPEFQDESLVDSQDELQTDPQAERRDDSQAGRRDSSQTVRRDDSQAGRRDGSQAERRDGSQTGRRDDPQTEAKTFSPDELDDYTEVRNAKGTAGSKRLLEKIAKLEKELGDSKDRTLRFQAELDNVRRRSSRELEEAFRYSGMDVIRDILPVMDNLQRAIEAAEKQSADDPLLAGVRMVYQQLETALEHNRCKKIQALHEPFDPNFHQAISQMPSEEFPEGTVLIVAQEGYTLEDRVVRPSQVVVSKGA